VRAAVEQMKQHGAEIIDVSLPAIDSLVQRSGVINHEFKFDLIEFLEQSGSARVHSLRDILGSGMYHVALEETFRNRDTVTLRDTDAYRVALARRDSVRTVVLSLLDEHRLDALVFPTLRRKPAMIGDPQRGGNCQLSAVSGLPALSAPAGFTPDGLPVGMELLGRTLADTRLLALAYAYEHAVHPRQAPPTTPPLVRGRAPAAISLILETDTASKAKVYTEFSIDRTRSTLRYRVDLRGVPIPRLLATSLIRTEPDGSGAMLFNLAGPGISRASGELALTGPELNALLNSSVLLAVYVDDPQGGIRARLVPGERPSRVIR
jgi:amidase